MLKLTFDNASDAKTDEDAITTQTDLVLLNEKNHPTPLAIGLIALELAFDVAVAVGAFTIMKAAKKRQR